MIDVGVHDDNISIHCDRCSVETDPWFYKVTKSFYFYKVMVFLEKNVITIGNFDGVHLGHRTLLQKTVQIAKHKNLKSLAITFDPSPKVYFGKKDFIYLTNLSEKIDLIKEQQIGYVEAVTFDHKLASLNGEEFVKLYLVQKFNIDTLVVGSDFGLGKNRDTDIFALQNLSRKYSFELVVVDKKLHQKDEISSQKIRELIKSGNTKVANQLLGRD